MGIGSKERMDALIFHNVNMVRSEMRISMDTGIFFIYLAVMAGVTYLLRTLPFVLCRNQVENTFLRSFLTYIPYAVLGAMTFPAVFSSTDSLETALAGTFAALCLAFFEKGLLTVAAGACLVAFLLQFIERIAAGGVF